MNFENLANELLLDLFEYFSSIELLQTFFGLNSRLNQLLYEHFYQCPLDCRSISKQKFLFLCKNQLPFISDQIISIYLSNDDETFDQLNLFISSNLHFYQFIRLKFLTLESINSTLILHQILSQCPQLIYLNIRKCSFDNQSHQAQLCLNTIWNLSQLQSCYLNDFFVELLTSNSSSITYLSIENHQLSFDCLISLFSFTSNLLNLNIQIRDNHDEPLFSFPIYSLTNLKLNFRGQWKTLKNFLENLPNLWKLNLQIYDIVIYGYEWEDLIENSLEKLQHFQYFNQYQFDQTKEIQQEFDDLFQSYETQFWIDQHQWFIRCDCQSESRKVYLYTLPFCFRRFNHYEYDLSKSTNENLKIFPYVQEIIFEKSLSKFPFQFSCIQHLELAIPFHENFWSIISNLDRLKTLEILSIAHTNDEFEQSIENLRYVLERSCHLYSLTIDYLILSQLSNETFLNRFIRRLDLMVNDGHFYGYECLNFIENLVKNQCEVLLINLECREIIVDLINKFTRLRTLICQCQDDQWGESFETNENINTDELIHWLTEHLSSTCSINRDDNEISVIRIWIH